MITNLDSLADRLKGIMVDGEELTAENLSSLISDEEEHNLDINQMTIMSDDELNEFKERVGKESARKGARTVIEMQIKEYRDKHGLSFEGKTLDNLLSAYGDKVLSDAKIPEAEKVKELQTSLSKLQSKYEDDQNDWANKIIQKEQQLNSFKADSFMIQRMPKLDNIKQNHMLAAFKADGYGISFDDSGNEIPTLHGNPIKDKMEKVMSYDDVLSNWATNNGYVKTEGRGGVNSGRQAGTGNFNNINDAFKYMEQNKIDPSSAEGQEIINKIQS